MAKTVDDYIAELSGWQADTVTALRRDILLAGGVTEGFKWGHPVYEAPSGPVALVKAHKNHVTLGLWRGAQMGELDSRLEAGGGFQMASIKLTGPAEITAVEIGRLVATGVSLNDKHGNPTKVR